MLHAQIPHGDLSRQVAATPAGHVPLLPPAFAGFSLRGSVAKSPDPGAADATNAQVLAEDGFEDSAAATYTSSVGSVSIRALRFRDASGAYAAYTFYRVPGMAAEHIGRGGASVGNRALFWDGTTVVDATFDHLSAMSLASLRELADLLPKVGGAAAVPPPLPGFLPRQDLEPTWTRYSLGPLGYARGGGVLPPAIVGFDKSAEVIHSGYSLRSGVGTLTLIEYPTPQIAMAYERSIAGYLKAGSQPRLPFPQALEESNTQALAVRRSGPLVAVTSGGMDAADAHQLLRQVNYEAALAFNNAGGFVPETTKAAHLLVNVVTFSLLTCGATLLLGLFLGGGRVLYRIARGKPASSMDEMEFIKLDLH
jgi:hypothetical protein